MSLTFSERYAIVWLTIQFLLARDRQKTNAAHLFLAALARKIVNDLVFL
jgi:hypothetical protein